MNHALQALHICSLCLILTPFLRSSPFYGWWNWAWSLIKFLTQGHKISEFKSWNSNLKLSGPFTAAYGLLRGHYHRITGRNWDWDAQWGVWDFSVAWKQRWNPLTLTPEVRTDNHVALIYRESRKAEFYLRLHSLRTGFSNSPCCLQIEISTKWYIPIIFKWGLLCLLH